MSKDEARLDEGDENFFTNKKKDTQKVQNRPSVSKHNKGKWFWVAIGEVKDEKKHGPCKKGLSESNVLCGWLGKAFGQSLSRTCLLGLVFDLKVAGICNLSRLPAITRLPFAKDTVGSFTSTA